MKKLLVLAIVAAFTATMIGCGPSAGTTTKATTGTGSTTAGTEVKGK